MVCVFCRKIRDVVQSQVGQELAIPVLNRKLIVCLFNQKSSQSKNKEKAAVDGRFIRSVQIMARATIHFKVTFFQAAMRLVTYPRPRAFHTRGGCVCAVMVVAVVTACIVMVMTPLPCRWAFWY